MHETKASEGTSTPPESLEAIQRFIDAPASQASTAFTPCPETRLGFDIGNCRFHIEVEWEDSRGRTGVGQPVQLTNDTGYFWFFSPANVELVIKVLDARSVNGQFWVFFGALSSVQYSVTVADRFTGAFRKYSNPSGTFASVGDTEAFSGGQTVTPVADATHAVSANFDATGGTVSATGADGTVFTLELPQDALPVPQTVTLTPVSSVGRLPFSGGLVAGVEIEPDGLDLSVPATLAIQPPSPLPSPEQTLPYSYAQGGEDFILYPRALDTSSLRLPLVRFGGYGIARGSLNEAETQAESATTGPLSSYIQRYALETLRRAIGLITPAELESRGSQIFDEAYDEQVAPFLPPGEGSSASGSRLKFRTCWLGELQEFLDVLFRVIRQRQTFGLSDLPDTPLRGLDVAVARVRACMEESFRLCVANHDPQEVLMIIKLARDLQLLGVEDPALTTFSEGSLVERCLRFELEFDSEFKFEVLHPVYSLMERLKYHARVPLRFSHAGNDYINQSHVEGACTLDPVDVALTLNAPPETCTANPPTIGAGRFEAKAAQLSLSILSNYLWMLYDPGYPSLDASLTCDGYNVPLPAVLFGATYTIAHENELSYNGFYVNQWRKLRGYVGSSPGDWAEKEYVRTFPDYGGSGSTLFENTRFFLRHTPDAPMPDCH